MFKQLGALSGLCLVLATPCAWAQGDDLDARREAWVIKARQGQIDAAIDGLARLYDATGDRAVLDDLIALRLRDERYAETLASCSQCAIDDYSSTSLEALGVAARRSGKLALARRYYQTLTMREPNNLQGWLGLALTNVDLGDYAAAGRTLDAIEARVGRSADWARARAYLAAATDDPIAELRSRQLLVQRQPQNDEQVQALYRLAITLGATGAAERLLESHPDAFTAADRLWLGYYNAQSKIRLARQLDDLSYAQQALTELDAVIDDPDAAKGLVQRAEYDKVVALNALRRFDQAKALTDTLKESYGPLPNYLKKARADALAGLHRPDEAAALYEELIDANPSLARDPQEPLYASLFYAYSDARRYDKAQKLLKKWKAEEPKRRRNFTGTQLIANPKREQIDQLELQLDAWRRGERQAASQLQPLLDQAPGNSGLWQNRGDIARWRGLPRQAEESYRRAAELAAPDDRHAANYGVLLSRLDRDQWRGTVATIESSIKQDPPSAARDNLARELDEQRAGGLTAEARHGDSDGPGVQSSRDWRYTTRLETPRSDSGSRFFAERIGLFGEYDERDLYAAYNALGYEANLFPAVLSIAAGKGAQLNDDGLLWGELDYALSDHWALQAGVEINSADTPLRALDDDINANLYSLGVEYRRDANGGGGLTLSALDLDDGNLRRALAGRWEERLYQYDRWRLDGELFLGTSYNDDVEASYFNPRRDASLDGALTAGYALPLGYRKTFLQNLTLGGGNYWQDDHGSDATWRIDYEHRWALAPRLSLHYGVSRQKNVYDGNPEYGTFITAGFDWRFL